MIATIDDIKSVRDISRNVLPDRIEPYIKEVEDTYIIPAIGADLYERLCEDGEMDLILTDGGFYSSGNGKDICHGLKKAIAYFAYCRIVRNNQVNVTAFGVTQKNSSLSTPISTDNIEAIVKDSTKMAEMYLDSCIRYLNRSASPCDGTPKKNFSIQILD